MATSAAARAADVSLEVSTREAFVDEPVTVQIVITDPKQHNPPTFPPIDGAQVRMDQRSSGENSQVRMVNGRWSQTTTVTYGFVVVPKRIGPLVIPPIPVHVDGRQFMTAKTVIQVVESRTGNLLYVDIASNRKSVYLGQSIAVDLEIWVAPYRDRNVRMNEQDMVNRIDYDNSRFGVFQDQMVRVRNGQGRWKFRHDSRVDDQGIQRPYYVYIISHEFVPTHTGPLDVGDVSIVVSYPMQTGSNSDVFSMFDRYRITKVRPVRAEADASSIEVVSPPDAGQPQYYGGAVGTYEFSVAASRGKVRVREPIELTMIVRGRGTLERVPPPPLADMEFLTRDFRVPTEDIAGVTEAGSKQFTVRISAAHAGVKEIPAIPFVFFDPDVAKYVTRWSDPIPLEVEDSEELSIAPFAESPAPRGPSAVQLTDTAAGIRSNYIDPSEVLAQQGFAPGWASMTLVAGCPLALAVCALLRWRNERLHSDPGIRRRRRAASTALQAIRQTSQQEASQESAAQLAGAVIHYVADRCNLPTGLTRAETVEHLAGRNLPQERLAMLDSFLRDCETLQYAGIQRAGGNDLTERAEGIVLAMEKERW